MRLTRIQLNEARRIRTERQKATRFKRRPSARSTHSLKKDDSATRIRQSSWRRNARGPKRVRPSLRCRPPTRNVSGAADNCKSCNKQRAYRECCCSLQQGRNCGGRSADSGYHRGENRDGLRDRRPSIRMIACSRHQYQIRLRSPPPVHTVQLWFIDTMRTTLENIDIEFSVRQQRSTCARWNISRTGIRSSSFLLNRTYNGRSFGAAGISRTGHGQQVMMISLAAPSTSTAQTPSSVSVALFWSALRYKENPFQQSIVRAAQGI
ncbi:hypothetical protein V8E36_006062 [Tilletia maclaganii]